MRAIISIFILLFILSCGKREVGGTTPWGTKIGEEDTAKGSGDVFSLSDIQAQGEMIMLTMSGPDYYYDYHGRGFGTQYLLCELFARRMGVTLRVEVCEDTTQMVTRLKDGEADIIVFPLPTDISGADSLTFCGARNDSTHTSWAIRKGNENLREALDKWYRPELVAHVKKFEDWIFSDHGVQRTVYAPVMSEVRGELSSYDHLFQRFAPDANADWRLLAALSYQESCFDPHARSWAGACGLMQLMPSTAAGLGVSSSSIFDPTTNVAAGARLIRQLQSSFSDVSDPNERMNFVLASYNGGIGHVRDAMALTQKYGGNKYRWAEVSQMILRLSEPRFYQDPVVKNGYMRGTETYNYVLLVRQRYQRYSGIASPSAVGSARSYEYTQPQHGSMSATPQRATHQHRWKPKDY